MSGLARTLTYAYDKDGKRVLLTHPDNQPFSTVRDGLGRVSNIYEGISQVSSAQLIQNSFSTRGLLTSMQRATSGSAFAAAFTYDPVGRLGSTFNDAAATANDLTISQTYSPASQIASQTRGNDAYSWTGSVAVNRAYTTNGLGPRARHLPQLGAHLAKRRYPHCNIPIEFFCFSRWQASAG